jgi:hypothetical protein
MPFVRIPLGRGSLPALQRAEGRRLRRRLLVVRECLRDRPGVHTARPQGRR